MATVMVNPSWSLTVARTDLTNEPTEIFKIIGVKGKYYFMAGSKLSTNG